MSGFLRAISDDAMPKRFQIMALLIGSYLLLK